MDKPPRSRLDLVLDLLHGAAEGALATHSVAIPGFPFASSLPFAPDDGHRPIFLISSLAEHTRNLLADERASLLLRERRAAPDSVRATLVGHVEPLAADEHLMRRYCRYQPDAEQFLQLGDFRFYRLNPLRIRIIGGFAQAGWLDGERLAAAPPLAPADETALIARFQSKAPAPLTLLGIDRFGIDLMRGDRRERIAFVQAPVGDEAVEASVADALGGLE